LLCLGWTEGEDECGTGGAGGSLWKRREVDARRQILARQQSISGTVPPGTHLINPGNPQRSSRFAAWDTGVPRRSRLSQFGIELILTLLKKKKTMLYASLRIFHWNFRVSSPLHRRHGVAHPCHPQGWRGRLGADKIAKSRVALLIDCISAQGPLTRQSLGCFHVASLLYSLNYWPPGTEMETTGQDPMRRKSCW
jgi:hypothetical protein